MQPVDDEDRAWKVSNLQALKQNSIQSHNEKIRVGGARYKHRHKLVSEVRNFTGSSVASYGLNTTRNSLRNRQSVFDANSNHLMSSIPSHERSIFSPPEHIGRPITSPVDTLPENALTSRKHIPPRNIVSKDSKRPTVGMYRREKQALARLTLPSPLDRTGYQSNVQSQSSSRGARHASTGRDVLQSRGTSIPSSRGSNQQIVNNYISINKYCVTNELPRGNEETGMAFGINFPTHRAQNTFN